MMQPTPISGLRNTPLTDPRAADISRPSTPVDPIPDGTMRYGMVGAGPRTTTQITAFGQLLLKKKADIKRFQERGAQFPRVEISVIEKQGEEYIGGGNAFGPNQDGSVNTPPETVGMDYGGRLMEHCTPEYRRQLESKYTQAGHYGNANLLRTAFAPTGETQGSKLSEQRAFLARKDLGAEERKTYLETKDKVLAAFSFVSIQEQVDTEVSRIDLSKPSKPQLRIMERGGPAQRIDFDNVKLNTGTTLVSPLKNKQLEELSYVGPMNTEAIGAYLKKRGRLEGGKLKKGTRLVLGGTGLSLYDTINTLIPFIKGIQEDRNSPTGVGVDRDELASMNYKLYVISNTPGKWIAPRHAHGPGYHLATKPPATARHQHALFLHKDGEEVFKTYYPLMLATIAAEKGITVDQVCQKNLTTVELLEAMHQSNAVQFKAKETNSAGAGQTVEGFRRELALDLILGLGMPGDGIDSTIEAMNRSAPLTFNGRAGYLMHRAQLAGLSRPDGLPQQARKEVLDTYNDLMADVTSSPAPIHDVAPLLFRTGLMEYHNGSYEALKVLEEEDRMALFDKDGNKLFEADGFLTSNVFRRSANPVIRSLAGQVQPIDKDIPDLPKHAPNRKLVATDGEISTVEDFSLNGKGERKLGLGQVGIDFTDVNNRESATQVAPGVASRMLSAIYLRAAGVENPEAELDLLYRSHMPEEQAYQAEVETFAPAFDEVMHRGAYTKAAREVAGNNGKLFAQLFAEENYQGARQALADVIALRGGEAGADDAGFARAYAETLDRYRELAGSLPKFEPVSRDRYFERFVDHPDHVHEAVLNAAEEKLEQYLNKPLHSLSADTRARDRVLGTRGRLAA